MTEDKEESRQNDGDDDTTCARDETRLSEALQLPPPVSASTPRSVTSAGGRETRLSSAGGREMRLSSACSYRSSRPASSASRSSAVRGDLAEFPTPSSLSQQQREYREERGGEERGGETVQGGGERGGEEREGASQPKPPPSAKSELLTGRHFTHIDLHVQKTPESLYSRPLWYLVDHLVTPASGSDDLDKVRAIFKWIAGQHITTQKMMPEQVVAGEEETVYDILMKLKSEEIQYADLFAEMCRNAGLTCEVLNGYVKGAKYVLGDDVPETSLGSWNAVFVDNSWRLVDPHWGSRHVVTTDDEQDDWVPIDDTGSTPRSTTSSETLEYRCNEFYFLTDPESFIFTHLPQEGAEWQLLSDPITLEQFHEMVYVKPEFFKVPLGVLTHPKCIIKTGNAGVEVKFSVPVRSANDQFKYKMFCDKSAEKRDAGRFLFMELQEGILRCLFRLPSNGRYKFELYAKARGEGSFALATAFLVEFTGDGEHEPLPGVSEEPWGPGPDVERLGLVPVTHPGGLVATTSGHAQIEFKVQGESVENIELATELLNNEMETEKLSRCVVHRLENGQAIFNLTLPKPGEYALQIFGKKKDEERKNCDLPMVCNYLIQNNKENIGVEKPILYPALLNGKLGLVPSADDLQVTSDPNTSYVHRYTNEEMIVNLTTSKSMHYLCELQLLTSDEEKDMSDYVLYNNNKGGVEIKMRFPTEGTYHLSIYSRTVNPGSRSEPFANMFNYIIVVHEATLAHEPFPKPFDMWSAGCILIEPEKGILPKQSTVRFAAVIPGAKKVSVVGKEWDQLALCGEMWEGKVETADNDKLTLTASYTNNTGKAPRQYTSLLVFQVVGNENDDESNKASSEEEGVRNAENYEKDANSENGVATEQEVKADVADNQAYSRPPSLLSKEERSRRKKEEKEKREREIRERLKAAIQKKERMDLETAIRDFKYAKLKDNNGDFKTGTKLLDFLRARDSLLESMMSQNLVRLRLAIKTVEKGGHEPKLKSEMVKARKLLESLERIDKLRRDVLNMDASTWSEVRRYTSPHSMVHKVIIGALLVLGDHEGRTKQWTNCQIYLTTIGSDGLTRRVGQFNVDDLHPEIAARARVILQDLDVEEVREVSAGIGAFHAWAMGMIEEFESRNRVLNPETWQPANQERQKQLLRGLRPPTPRPRDVIQPVPLINPPPSPYSSLSLERSTTNLSTYRKASGRAGERRPPEQGWGAAQKASPRGQGGKSPFPLRERKLLDLQGRRGTKANILGRHESLLGLPKSKTSLF